MFHTSSEEDFRRLSLEIKLLENTAQVLQSRINFVNAALADLRMARMSLEGLSKEKKGAELMVPIGGGSFIKVKLEDPNTVIAGVGAGVSVEKTLPEALNSIKTRIEELEKMNETLNQRLSQVIQRINEGRTKLQKIAEELSSK
ncbi:prefoldin subunit alpha [Candidatus Bathyarchaeota archaeon]|nr:prefoldin subunit alpha [Candidatus Bathyarchaeota archaeon]PDM26383.1 MAG: prefoldin subunit alpha [Candidatus Bathyarchaeota archaeon B24-2]HDN62429.1 prefoldin subunit alpha [Candidatus Bathyarchaeota archaeon]